MKNIKPEILVILTPGFPENEEDSTCIPPQQIFVKALKEVNPELNIIVLAFQYPFFAKEYLWNGIKIISFGNKYNSKVLRKLSGLKIWMFLTQINRNYHIVGLLSFWLGKCALIGDKFARKYHLKHLCWLLGQDAKAGNKYAAKMKLKGNLLIALSDFIVRESEKNYGVKPQYVIPVGIDTALFKNDTAKRDIDILGVGSLIPLKQYSVFIEIINSLKEFFPHIKAVICGNGPKMKQLAAMVNNLNLGNNISLIGRLKHPEVLAIMQRSKVFLHTSEYEGFGAVCLEALYAGAKVVSFVKPMDAAIKNWHIATDVKHAGQLIAGILGDKSICYQQVLKYSIHDNARTMLNLYTQSVLAIS